MPYHPEESENLFTTAIRNVFKSINKTYFEDKLTLSNRSCRVLNDMIVDAFQKLLMETQILMTHDKRRVMTSKALDGAVRLLIQPPSFAERFQFYGRKAVCDYFHNLKWEVAAIVNEFDISCKHISSLASKFVGLN